ncbi:MAG: RmuC-domain protein [Firmicutes bacterium]|nr:RmuC-domain protein [Bacillota bacterium]
MDRLERRPKEELARDRGEIGLNSKALREEIGNSLKEFSDSVGRQMAGTFQLQVSQNEMLVKQLQILTTANEQRMDKMREGVEGKLKENFYIFNNCTN